MQNSKETLLTEFEQKLKSHDWYFQMADDYRYYKAGERELVVIKDLARNLIKNGLLNEAIELLYFGKKIIAEEAEQLGFVNKVVSSSELMSYAREQARRLIPPKGPSLSIRLMKKTMHEYFKNILPQTLDLENEGLRALFKTHDFRAATKSLITKKEPIFKGK